MTHASKQPGSRVRAALVLGALVVLTAGIARAAESHGPALFSVKHPTGLGPGGMLTDAQGAVMTFATEEAAQEVIKQRALADVNAGQNQSAADYKLVALAEDQSHGTLDLFKIHPGASYWLLITFALLFLILRRTAWPKIVAGLEAREQHIVSSVKAAERANTEAAALLAQYEQKLARARDEAQVFIDEGKRDAAKVKDEIVRQAWKDAEVIKEQARREMELAASAVVKDIYAKMAVLSTDIASRIIERELSASEHVRLVDDAIAKYSRS